MNNERQNPERPQSSTERSQESSAQARERRRKPFSELPGTNEGKAALMEFELGNLDFIESPDGDVIEEQIRFDFGQEFEVQATSPVAVQSRSLAPLITGGAQSIFPGLDADSGASAPWAGDDDAQLAFGDAESDDVRAPMLLDPGATKGSAASDRTVVDEAQLNSASESGHALRSDGIEIESRDEFVDGADELELRRTEPLILDEAALPSLQVGTDDELMQSIDSIPDKMAFKIGEVAEMVGVKQYVLRYWESEFDALRPRKSRNGQRVYTRRDVETALMIKKLLYTDRFSIEGARHALKQLKSRVREEKEWKRLLASHERVSAGLRALVGEIKRLRDVLS